MEPMIAPLQPAPVLPRGGNTREFAQAAREAIGAAEPFLTRPELRAMLAYVPPGYPFTNIYLSRGLRFMGFTAAIQDTRRARQRRRQVFTKVNDIWWAISFNREAKTAVAHHRSGYRARFVAR